MGLLTRQNVFRVAIILAFLMSISMLLKTSGEWEVFVSNLGVVSDLDRSTSKLTGLARSYVEFGSQDDMRSFNEELERRGKAGVNILSRLQSLDEESLALAEASMLLSDQLAVVESRAFAAFDRGEIATAKDGVYGKEYQDIKSKIISNINELDIAVVKSCEKRMRSLFTTMLILMLVILAGWIADSVFLSMED